MKVALVGVSHHRAPVELRERVALDGQAASALAARLGREAVVLSTCNRTELYLVRQDDAEELGVKTLIELAGDQAEELGEVLYRLGDEAAALHLFRVAAGLDSLVPGEGEILGQVRSAFESGSTGPVLDRLFRQALHAGRRVRVETAIGESPASVPAAGAALAQQVFENLAGKRVLLLGAGKTSELTARNLVSRGARIGAVANRTLERAQELADAFGARAVGLDDLGEELAAADVVVASTSSPEPIVRKAEVAAALRSRRGRPLLLVDLAVPRDSIRRSTSSTTAFCTTSTISRPSWQRRSPAAAARQRGPSSSSPPKPSSFAAGTPRSTSSRRSRHCVRSSRRSETASSSGPARGFRRRSGSTSNR